MKTKKIEKKLLIIGALITALFLTFFKLRPQTLDISYNEFLVKLDNNEISQVTLTNSDKISFKTQNDDTLFYTENPRKTDFKEQLLLEGITVKESNKTNGDVFGLVLIGAIAFFMVKSSGNKKTEIKYTQVTDKAIKFKDIAGNEEAKESVNDIVEFIKNPEKFEKYGAKMPRGLIFYGPPGTGKTMLAKALAGECEVPFYAVSGSDFVQKYVGVGAKRIRDLFKKAREQKKAVIFIDEIDAIGKKRNNDASQGNDERDQTLNALLTEMSGFNSGEGIIVIAATNRLDILDDALLRPGRFDRQIEIGLPDFSARVSILEHYIKDLPIAKNLNSHELAKQTVYFSGAMLSNLVNEASIFAAKTDAEFIGQKEFEKAFYTILAGSEKTNRSDQKEIERQITSYHEAGHALATKLLLKENSVSKVTIIPSVKGIGGFSLNIPPDKMYYTKNEIKNQIIVNFAGRAAEEIIFGKDNITTGANNDIEKATKLAKDYVTKYGMSDNTGIIYTSLFKDESEVLKDCKLMLTNFYNETISLLTENKHLLEIIAKELLEKETLNETDLNKIIC